MDLPVSLWAVLLAAVSSMVVGMIWYARPVFGDMWAKLAGVDMNSKETAKKAPMALTVAFVMSLLTAYVLAHVTALSHNFFHYGIMETALTTAFWLWLGLCLTTVLTHDAFEQRPWKLSALTVGNRLVTLLAMALMIGWVGGY